MMITRLSTATALIVLGGLAGCRGGHQTPQSPLLRCRDPTAQMKGGKAVPRKAAAQASSAFWKRWSDGKGELLGYRLTMNRYGHLRRGYEALVYVTEDMDRRTWVKADAGPIPKSERVTVLKLNRALRFRTGIYPYSVMTSVFSPVNGLGRERFAPVKITFTAQEWCGHVFQMLRPRIDRFGNRIHSYFGAEGDVADVVKTKPFALYEDALWIQLRELDGPFAGGRDWSGDIVPSLWRRRTAHTKLRPVPGRIERRDVQSAGKAATRFVIVYGGKRLTVDIEKAPARRILSWRDSDGSHAELLGSTRLAYWKLNGPGGEKYLRELGLPVPGAASPTPGQPGQPTAPPTSPGGKR